MPPSPPSASPPIAPSGGASAAHVDVDALVEDYAWRRFKELQTVKGTGLESFKHLEIADVEFDIVSSETEGALGDFGTVQNRKKLILTHAQPNYNNIQLTGTRPNTICEWWAGALCNPISCTFPVKSVFTNNTSQVQAYSLKTERTSESICGVAREQGFMFGAEAELTLKTPCQQPKGGKIKQIEPKIQAKLRS